MVRFRAWQLLFEMVMGNDQENGMDQANKSFWGMHHELHVKFKF
jgi:hypothetical protein